MTDFERAEKLPAAQRYFNISIIWIFYFRYLLRFLYWLRIPHEIVTLLSLGFGLSSAYFFFHGNLLAAAILLHFKDSFDACDGALARLTGRGHLIGRYLDSLGDFLVLTAVVVAITWRSYSAGNLGFLLWGVVAVFSIFLQCSFFNCYQIAYVEQCRIGSLSSRRDEVSRGDLDRSAMSTPARLLLNFFRFLYIIVYSWQDRLVAAVDNGLHKRCITCPNDIWYGEKLMLTLQSPLCFGTHIFVLIIAALAGRPQLGLIFIATVMNLYLLWLLYYRGRRYLDYPAPAQTGAVVKTKGI